MAHALLVHTTSKHASSSSSLSSAATQRPSSSITSAYSTDMSKCSQNVPAEHDHSFHDAVPPYAFEEAEKSTAAFSSFSLPPPYGPNNRTPDSVVDECRVTGAGRLQQYLLRSEKMRVYGVWNCSSSGFEDGRLSYEEGVDCRQSFYQQNQHHGGVYGEGQMAVGGLGGRCVTPTYLDALMNDSDASCGSGSGSGSDDYSGVDDDDFHLDPAALVASMDPSSTYFSASNTLDNDDVLQSLVEFGRVPRMFDNTPSTNMSFFISPLAISQLARGLWTRSEPVCVIIHTRLPRRTSRFDDFPWSSDALRMLNLPNAGGSSLLSEVLSCEMLYRCLGARLAKTEMEIRYFFAYQPMTDYTISLPGLAAGYHVGVSVTRAFAYKGAYRRSECRKLLKKKLAGITASTRNVMDERLFKQILHVWVPNGKVARTVQATYRTLSQDLRRNSVVVISVVNAAWVFSNRR
ncbi:hypothetical protein BGX33_008528 [Mortierella sp. NVP41]|nr:hypothetical protein BGX33_008528 [Mortierella sp. NVP41]